MMNQQTTHSRSYLYLLPYAAFLAITYIYFGFIAGYILYFQEKSSLFIFSYDFLQEHLNKPGGLLIWLGKFLSAFYYYPHIGAFILSSVLTLIVFSITKISYKLTGKYSLVISFLIGATLFYLHTNYRFLLFNSLGLLLQLVFFWLVIRYITFLKGWVSVICVPILYYVTGSFTCIYLLLMTSFLFYDKIKTMWTRVFSIYLLSLIVYFLSHEFLFFQSDKTLLTYPLFQFNIQSQKIVFISVLGFISLLPLIFKIRFRKPVKFSMSVVLQSILGTIILIIILTLSAIQNYDAKTKNYFYVQKLFYENKFDEVIAHNTANPPTNLLTIYLNNIALCETGKLDDQLFRFPQNKEGKTLFLEWKLETEILNNGGYFYYTTGMINEAHRWAFENMVMKGLTSDGLKMLIQTELIYANYNMAEKYIGILKKTFFYRTEARSFENMLKTGLTNGSDNEIVKKRMTKTEHDFFTLTDNPFLNLEMTLASDSLNRNAFEYKMAFLLLKKNYPEILHELPKFERLGYTHLPVHIEEAVIALAVSNNGKIPDTGNLRISKKTELRWNQFLSVLQQNGNNVKSAEPELKRRFGDTFWYYVFFR
jgi:hypothetical protein